MIPRITRGRSAYGALSYDHGPGRADDHQNPHKVAGNVAGRSWKMRSAVIDEHIRRMHSKLSNPIIRTSLRISPDDRRLTDREWRSVATEYVRKMGFDGAPWEAVRHAEDHIHLTLSRVNWDGTVVDQWRDKTRAQTVVRDIERNHGLVDASTRYNRDAPEISRNDRERVARAARAAQQPNRQPEKTLLRNKIDAALGRSAGSRESYEAELQREGVRFRSNVSAPTERSPQGRMNGYSYGLVGHTDNEGADVWFKGSKLGQRYGWARTSAALHDRTVEQPRGDKITIPDRTNDVEGKRVRSDSEAVSRQPIDPQTENIDRADGQTDELRQRYLRRRGHRRQTNDDRERRRGRDR